MRGPIEAIRCYVLHPDHNGLHLRKLAEKMADADSLPPSFGPGVRQQKLEAAAETVARFIHLVWGPAGPEEYVPRTYEMLVGLQQRMRGMAPGDTWDYALATLGMDIHQRLRKARAVTIDPDLETALIHRFFDGLEEHEYLADVAQKIMDLHWKRRHGPGAITEEEIRRSKGAPKSRGEPSIERHLERLAKEGLATYIEQANIGWGNLENPTDPTIVLRDRIEIQLRLGGKNAHTWEESAWRLADLIERRFGTAASRRQARAARAAW